MRYHKYSWLLNTSCRGKKRFLWNNNSCRIPTFNRCRKFSMILFVNKQTNQTEKTSFQWNQFNFSSPDAYFLKWWEGVVPFKKKGIFRAPCMVARFRADSAHLRGAAHLSSSKLLHSHWSWCHFAVNFFPCVQHSCGSSGILRQLQVTYDFRTRCACT